MTAQTNKTWFPSLYYASTLSKLSVHTISNGFRNSESLH